MKKELSIIITLLFIVCAFSQEMPARKGKIGASFYFTALDLKSFEKKLGFRYWITSDIALNGNFSFFAKNYEKETGPDVEKNKRGNLGIYVEIDKFFKPNRKISPFAGAFLSTWIYRLRVPPPHGDRIEKNNSFASGISLGVNCWLSGYITLSTQYLLSYNYEKLTDKQYGYISFKKSAIWIDSEKFYLILTVYF